MKGSWVRVLTKYVMYKSSPGVETGPSGPGCDECANVQEVLYLLRLISSVGLPGAQGSHAAGTRCGDHVSIVGTRMPVVMKCRCEEVLSALPLGDLWLRYLGRPPTTLGGFGGLANPPNPWATLGGQKQVTDGHSVCC